MDGGQEKVAAARRNHPVFFQADRLLFTVGKLNGKETLAVSILAGLAKDRVVA